MPSLFIIFLSGLVGLGVGQTAKLNLISLPQLLAAPAAAFAASPLTCQVEVDFYDANNKLVKSQVLSLSPGQSKQSSLSRLELGARVAPHPLFWIEAFTKSCSSNDGCTLDDCNVVAAGEEVDTLGNTNLVFTGQRRLANAE